MRINGDTILYVKSELPKDVIRSANMVQFVSGQESDAGLVDYTLVSPDEIDNIDPAERLAALKRNEVYHPVERRWVKAGSFKQPSRQYIERMYAVDTDFLCWDSTYGCFIIDPSKGALDKSSPSERELWPSWARPNVAFRTGSNPGLPIGEQYKEVMCSYNYPRFVGYFTYGITEEQASRYNEYHKGFHTREKHRNKSIRIADVSGQPKGEKPSDDSVYDWLEGKWCKPGDHQVPGDIPEGWARSHQWYIWDTALGMYRKPGDWKTKNWLDDYSSLIMDGIVSYGGEVQLYRKDFLTNVGNQGDKYIGTRSDGDYAAFAEEERAKFIEYMKGES